MKQIANIQLYFFGLTGFPACGKMKLKKTERKGWRFMEKYDPVHVTFLHCAEKRALQPEEYQLLMPLQGELTVTKPSHMLVETGSLLFLTPVFRGTVQAAAGADLLCALIPADLLEPVAGVPGCPSAVVFSGDSRQLAERMAALFDLQYNRDTVSYLDQLTASCQLLQELTALISKELFEPVQAAAGSDRKNQMIVWIEQNFRRPVQLQDFADAFGLSRQHSSSVFHQETGISFSDYLLELRLNEAQRLLRSTDKSISAVSEESGFPNTKSFHSAFQRAFNTTPKAWRQENRPDQADAAPEPQDLLTANRLLQEHRMLYPLQEATVHMTEEIAADHAAPFPPVWNDILNADIAASCLKPASQAHLTDIQQHLRFRYIRLNTLLTDDLFEFFPDTRQYRFTDFIYLTEFLRKIGLTPMLTFGGGRRITVSGVIFTEGGYSVSQESWLQFLRDLLRVSIRHWGAAWVSTWRFEFFMPPTLYGSPDPDAFFDLFEASVKLIKEMLPQAAVGGPAQPLDNMRVPLWQTWLRTVSARRIPVDFVSMEMWADFDVQTAQLQGQSGEALQTHTVRTLASADTMLPRQKVQQMREMMQAYGLSEKKLYISALGISEYQAMATQIGGHCAAYLIRCCLDLQPLVDGIGCWKAYNSEAEYADEYSLLSSGCGIVERFGLHYPAWYAYQFLQSLYPNLVFQGSSTCITTDGEGRYALLLHNCKNYSRVFCKNYMEPVALEFRNPQLYTGYSAIALNLTLTMLRPQRYRVTRFLIGDYHGCLAQVIRQIGDLDPTEEGIRSYLAGQISPYRQSCIEESAGTLTLNLNLQPNEVMLVRVEPEEKP